MITVIEQPGRRRTPKPTLARAEYLLSVGDPRGALACAKKMLRRDPRQLGALEILAKSLWQLSRYEELLSALGFMIRLNPYEPGYHALRGAAHQALGRTGEAIKSFVRAGNDSETSNAAIEELREWQSSLIADLLRDDVVFRTHYAQDPAGACRRKGFEFMPDLRPGESWLARPHAQIAAWARPS